MERSSGEKCCGADADASRSNVEYSLTPLTEN
jgi:hypothetical protein